MNFDSTLESAGRAVQAHRYLCNLSRAQVADMAEVHPDAVEALEKGDGMVRWADVHAILVALDMPVPSLVVVPPKPAHGAGRRGDREILISPHD